MTTKSKKKFKTVRSNTSKLLVRIIEDESDMLNVKLGISDENLNRLFNIAKPLLEKGVGVSEIMVELSKHCKHANELVYIIFALGRNTGNTHPLAGVIAEIIGRHTKGKEDKS